MTASHPPTSLLGRTVNVSQIVRPAVARPLSPTLTSPLLSGIVLGVSSSPAGFVLLVSVVHSDGGRIAAGTLRAFQVIYEPSPVEYEVTVEP